jgi:hypothetical protein
VVVEPTWVRVQVALGVNVPDAGPFEKVMEPCGYDFVPASVSETVAVHVELSLIGTELGAQLTEVDVVRFVTVTAEPVVSELFMWTPSPAL